MKALLPLPLKIPEEDVKEKIEEPTYIVTNVWGCTLDTRGFFLHVAINNLSSNDKDLTEPDKTCEKSLALRGCGMDLNADICL